MKKQTTEEFVKEFNSIMRLIGDRASTLSGDFDWSGEDLENIGQERLYDLHKLVTRLNILVTIPFKENEEI